MYHFYKIKNKYLQNFKKWKFILSLGYIRTSKSVKAMTFFWMKMLENPKKN